MTDAEAITLLDSLRAESNSEKQDILAQYSTVDQRALAAAREIRDSLQAAQSAQQ